MIQTLCLAADAAAVERAAALLRAGELVGFPTETVYGLGANALDEAAVRAVFAAKERPADNPLIAHVARAEDIEPLCHVNDAARALIAAYWPGPLTLLLQKKAVVPSVTTAGLPTVAVRMPAHPVARALIAAAGVPVAAPSGNRSGRPSPTCAAHMLEDMNGRIPLILDGGPCSVGVESTVVDLSGGEATILRPGGVTPEQIERVLGAARVAGSVMRPLRPGEQARSPGMRHRHYAPRGQMTVVCGARARVAQEICRLYDQSENACILAMEDNLPRYGARRVKSLGAGAQDVAQNLFARLRESDAEGVSRILCEGLAAQGVGLAVMNRMARAAAFDVRQV